MSEPKESELVERLRASEERLRLVVESTPAGVAVVDRNLVYIACSQRWVQDYGLGGQQVIGRSHYDVFPEIPERWRRIHQNCLAGAADRCDEDRFERADGSVQYLRWAIQPWREPGGAVGGLIFFTEDITEHKRMQEQLIQSQKLASLGTLAGGIAHDFNNILAIILGYLPILEAARLEKESFEGTLRGIQKTIERATGLSQQLLTFGQNRLGRIEPVDVRSLLSSLLDILKQTFPRTISIEFRAEDDLPSGLLEAGQFQQVLMNLCLNARDAMPEGGALLLRAVRADPDELAGRLADPHGKEFLRVVVEDTGTGMEETTRLRAFEPFYTTKGPGRGTGLGLAVVYNIMEQHGGFVEVTSKPGHGTQVTLFIPSTRESPAPDFVAPAPVIQHAEELLVVEDEPMLREITQWSLMAAGFRVLTAADGPSALATFEQNPNVAAVVCDLGLPGMSGAKLIDRLMQMRPATGIVVTSGYIDAAAQEELRSLGARLLQKPFRREELVLAVESALNP